jgi:hypothetical protein
MTINENSMPGSAAWLPTDVPPRCARPIHPEQGEHRGQRRDEKIPGENDEDREKAERSEPAKFGGDRIAVRQWRDVGRHQSSGDVQCIAPALPSLPFVNQYEMGSREVP